VYVGVHQGLRPLATIEREIAVRSPNDLRAITVEGTPREIQPMLTRLNRLFALLRQASAGQQRFLADAAHQLRTPLTGLQTQIELAAAEGRFDGDVERRQRFDEATRRIAHLIDQLLLFARAEAAGAAPLFEPVSLPTLLEQAASIFLDQALAREIDLGFEVAPATVVGIPSLLREALANLIDNALRYTPAQGVVTVRCGCRDQHAFLEVEDDGPGIPPAAREQVFERFTRLPAAPGNGCGLGLAIVREIAELHSATVELANPDGGRGLRIALLFPVQATATESAATRHDAQDERR
ncbi:MAG TPA: ATP-binding protein, partial [Accumulibacter sp.]|nr:ATP-binding protein [Accumulibacter sp.]